MRSKKLEFTLVSFHHHKVCSEVICYPEIYRSGFLDLRRMEGFGAAAMGNIMGGGWRNRQNAEQQWGLDWSWKAWTCRRVIWHESWPGPATLTIIEQLPRLQTLSCPKHTDSHMQALAHTLTHSKVWAKWFVKSPSKTIDHGIEETL